MRGPRCAVFSLRGARRRDSEPRYSFVFSATRWLVAGFTPPSLALGHHKLHSNAGWSYLRDRNEVAVKVEYAI